MITKYYSNADPKKLLHIVCRAVEIEDDRADLVDAGEYLQLAVLNYEKGKTFAPHKHIFKEVPNRAIAQESWVVLRGSVKAIFYDEEGVLVGEEVLHPGDVSITLYGGHNYEILDEDTMVLEYKTGPYYGQALDKVFIND
jgi:hypothetical protein